MYFILLHFLDIFYNIYATERERSKFYRHIEISRAQQVFLLF